MAIFSTGANYSDFVARLSLAALETKAKCWFEARRKISIEQQAVVHLRQLPAYLLEDADIDRLSLNSTDPRIVVAQSRLQQG